MFFLIIAYFVDHKNRTIKAKIHYSTGKVSMANPFQLLFKVMYSILNREPGSEMLIQIATFSPKGNFSRLTKGNLIHDFTWAFAYVCVCVSW